MPIEKLEKKYMNIVSYTRVNSDDPHSMLMEIVHKIRRSGANGSSLGILEQIGDFYAESAPILRKMNMEQRWNPLEVRENGRREYDKTPSYEKKPTEVQLRHEGKEEFLACVIYDLANSKKRDKFVTSFFDKKSISNLNLIGSYYTGQFSGNNTLFDTLLVAGSAGKAIAPKIASTIEKIVDHEVRSKTVYDLRGIAIEASRMYYLSGKKQFESYMKRLAKKNPSLYEEAHMDDPRTLITYSGTLDNGTTFAQRLDNLKIEAKKAIGLADKNGKQIKPITRANLTKVQRAEVKKDEALVNKAVDKLFPNNKRKSNLKLILNANA